MSTPLDLTDRSIEDRQVLLTNYLMFYSATNVGAETELRLVPFRNCLTLRTNYNKWFNDPLVLKYLYPNTPSLGTGRRLSIEEFIHNAVNRMDLWYFAIFPFNVYGPVGHVSFSGIDYINLSANLGLVIGDTSYWGQGIGRDAATLACTFAAGGGLKSLRADTVLENKSSFNILAALSDRTRVINDPLTEQYGYRVQFDIDLSRFKTA